jgi:BspA type Leucine rich repeat region (6 copies)/Bacterial Ig domain
MTACAAKGLLLLLLLPVMVQAQFNFVTNNGAITITGYTGPGGEVIIPSTINGCPVTSIGDDAFEGSSLHSVTISSSVTIPDSVTSIGSYAFGFCNGLLSVTIGNGVTSIGSNAFVCCTSLGSVTIGNSVTSIGPHAFDTCESLTSITIGTNVTSIGNYAFAGCSRLWSTTIPNSVTNIGDWAFYLCPILKGIYFNGTPPSVGSNTFNSDYVTIYYLSGTTGWGTTFGGLPTGLWDPQTQFGYMIINGTITIMGYSGSFAAAVTIPNTIVGLPVTRIGDSVFCECYNSLTSVTIPNTVTNIGDYVFYECYSLTSVYFKGNAPPSVGSNVFENDINPIVYYLAGTTGWSSTFGGVPTVKVQPSNPRLVITSPVSGRLWSNGVFTVMGTASDNVRVSSVWFQVNSNGWQLATTSNNWTNWTATANLIIGTNVLQSYAVNAFDYNSTKASVNLIYVVTNELQVRIVGLGAISPNYSNAWLQIGRNYSITSSPASGFILTNWVISTNWSGGALATNKALLFTMVSNLTLQVNFVDVTRPTNSITAPTAGKHMTNALATVVGTAKDNWKVVGVWYQLNNGSWNLSPTTNGWTNWTTTLQLVVGTNTVKAYAMDLGGNFSATNSLNIVSSNTFKLQLAFTNTLPLKTNGLVFSLQLSTGLNGHIQVSTNLTSWITLTNFVGTNSTITFRDPAATNFNHRFYRAVVP